MCEIEERLWQMRDEQYKEFHRKLIPNIKEDSIIGVRTPALRTYAKELLREAKGDPACEQRIEQFKKELPHHYYEENNLHGLLIEGMKDFVPCMEALEEFLPYIDNWATCDLISPKVLISQPEALLQKIEEWMASDHTYTIRFGMEMLMRHFLDDRFERVYLDWVAEKRSEEYYVNMMIAWFFATALAKQYEATLPYLENRVLDTWTHNKTIQKAIESYRITPEQKTCLRELKVKR